VRLTCEFLRPKAKKPESTDYANDLPDNDSRTQQSPPRIDAAHDLVDSPEQPKCGRHPPHYQIGIACRINDSAENPKSRDRVQRPIRRLGNCDVASLAVAEPPTMREQAPHPRTLREPLERSRLAIWQIARLQPELSSWAGLNSARPVARTSRLPSTGSPTRTLTSTSTTLAAKLGSDAHRHLMSVAPFAAAK